MHQPPRSVGIEPGTYCHQQRRSFAGVLHLDHRDTRCSETPNLKSDLLPMSKYNWGGKSEKKFHEDSNYFPQEGKEPNNNRTKKSQDWRRFLKANVAMHVMEQHDPGMTVEKDVVNRAANVRDMYFKHKKTDQQVQRFYSKEQLEEFDVRRSRIREVAAVEGVPRWAMTVHDKPIGKDKRGPRHPENLKAVNKSDCSLIFMS